MNSKADNAEKEYSLGTDRKELIRLGFQHQLWNEQTAKSWSRAKFGIGQTLLDLGCGPGYVSFELSRLVGEKGKIISVDSSNRFIEYLKQQIVARSVSNIEPLLSSAEKLDVPANSVDGVFVRWVLCFLSEPQKVIAEVARILKPGGVFVVMDYYNYEAVTLSPKSDILNKICQAVHKAFQINNGNADICDNVPTMMEEVGLKVKELTPVIRIARPGEPLWSWPKTFFDNFLPTLIEMKLLTKEDHLLFEEEWEKRSQDPGSFFTTPPILEAIGIKK